MAGRETGPYLTLDGCQCRLVALPLTPVAEHRPEADEAGGCEKESTGDEGHHECSVAVVGVAGQDVQIRQLHQERTDPDDPHRPAYPAEVREHLAEVAPFGGTSSMDEAPDEQQYECHESNRVDGHNYTSRKRSTDIFRF